MLSVFQAIGFWLAVAQLGAIEDCVPFRVAYLHTDESCGARLEGM